IGWSAAEFAAVGVEFAGRGERADEYVEAMRVLWRDDVSTFQGTRVWFDRVRCYPKPLGRRIPIVIGGNSEAALDRVARYGDGWYGFGLASDQVGDRLAELDAACRRRGRSRSDISVAVSLSDAAPDHVGDLAALGVDEVVLIGAPPGRADDAAPWVNDLADQWGVGSTPA
ncbi:MAG TPA: LLM class flavin-dependent oxidoreductase, partial [Acidimicrobiales bacterium]|nr:LLM class flavin-dependent oxidoreductase [Acidimicrobiales bacterium]